MKTSQLMTRCHTIAKKTMRSINSLIVQLEAMDGKDYAVYQSIKGTYQYPKFDLSIDQIPQDPYAPPSTGIFRISVSHEISGISAELTCSTIATTALSDYLTRQFYTQCKTFIKKTRGTGNSGLITIVEPKQTILERTAIVIGKNTTETRFFMGLPAKGRNIKADLAIKMLTQELPEIVESSLFLEHLDNKTIKRHIQFAEDTHALRKKLPALGLIGFIAEGALLPRESGIDQRPLMSSEAIPFKSPQSLRVSITLPHCGTVTGMGIPTGVTLIVGGGYHGKSTLLNALQLGVYNHIAGDGRELCVSHPNSVKIRASSGRFVANADISTFISKLPFQKDMRSFCTENASGSTSQAASIVEAIEVGAKVLLMDEDTCAANFMIRDLRMQSLVAKDDEPITAFIDIVQQLYKEHGISTVLVMGGSGDYFDVADHCIQMKNFQALDVTEKAQQIVRTFPTNRHNEGHKPNGKSLPRKPITDSLNPINEYGKFKVAATSPGELIFGKSSINLADVEQLTETAQTKAIGLAIVHAKNYMDGNNTLADIANRIMDEIDQNGLDYLDQTFTGDLAEFRKAEFAAVLNRIRGLRLNQQNSNTLIYE